MTLESPWITATFVISPPTTISKKPVHATFGAAIRQFNSTEDAKYSTAISKKMIHNSRTSSPCAVSTR